jgi:hypothetical protein
MALSLNDTYPNCKPTPLPATSGRAATTLHQSATAFWLYQASGHRRASGTPSSAAPAAVNTQGVTSGCQPPLLPGVRAASAAAEARGAIICQPERVCTVLFFGAEIQPKHLVFSLVFRWFSAFSPHPLNAQSFLRKPSFLVLASKQLLGFLEVVYMLK